MKLLHQCNYSSCHKLIPQDQRYCPIHKRFEIKQKQKWTKTYNKTRYERNPLTENYHTSQWRKLREAVLARDFHLCQECLRHGHIKSASHVDHIKAAVDHPKLFWDMDNLQSLCVSCHSHKTIEEQRIKNMRSKNKGR
ncbi:HNH endonuclease [Sporolactobacillus sp. CQH2019]|uniref:HNH endonuclease n=1 Tax=Sporolactobacillus sp. CQH2019 TaxID=3023512 RepID=UPI003FD4FC2E